MDEINVLIGNEMAQTGPSLTQVYLATHKDGLRLPFMNRSFISFSFGGKNIEDFNLIATTIGDRLERDAYASFEDLTSLYDTILGLFYWNTYFHTNSITFNLATDAMTLKELDEFKFWFRAGKIKELILAEHPNRAIMARVANPPQLKLLPFETSAQVKFLHGTEEIGYTDIYYNTSTTLYRGEIVLELVMDEPFWYAKLNILGRLVAQLGYYEDGWTDANGTFIHDIKDSKDALKIIYEDLIPLGSAVLISVFLGGDIYAAISYAPYSKIVVNSNEEEYNLKSVDSNLTMQLRSAYIKENNSKYVEGGDEPQFLYYCGAAIAYPSPENAEVLIGGKIAGADLNGVDEGTGGIDLPPAESAYLYYAGTAPSPVKLTFSLMPQFSQGYIISPFNKYSVELEISTNPYNTITLTATKEHVFLFTTPSLYTSYNQVIKIFKDEDIMNPNNAWLVVRETIRDTVRHPIVRKWANKILDKYHGKGHRDGTIKDSGASLNDVIDDLVNGMYIMLMIKDSNKNIENTLPAIFTFDGKTGEAIGHYVLRDPDKLTITEDGGSCMDLIIAQTETENDFYTIEIEENVGDMVKSSYLILDERNTLDEYARVNQHTDINPDYSYEITHDVVRGEGLKSLRFEFKNMYL